MKVTRVLHGLLGLLLTVNCQADAINIAVAANFSAPMEKITALFAERTGHQVQIATGSSGLFYAQIVNGAPYAMFFSADEEKPTALVEAGFAVADSKFTYAVGRLALWSANPQLVDAEGKVLAEGRFNKLAMANPKLAPYGKAALEVLTTLDLVAATKAKWVQGENIAQTFQFVYTANADIGLVAMSQIVDKNLVGSHWLVPANLHSPIRQDAVILQSAKNNVVAAAFRQFMVSDEVAEVIRHYGYELIQK